MAGAGIGGAGPPNPHSAVQVKLKLGPHSLSFPQFEPGHIREEDGVNSGVQSSPGQEEEEEEVRRQVRCVAAAESHWLLHTMNILQCNLWLLPPTCTGDKNSFEKDLAVKEVLPFSWKSWRQASWDKIPSFAEKNVSLDNKSYSI